MSYWLVTASAIDFELNSIWTLYHDLSLCDWLSLSGQLIVRDQLSRFGSASAYFSEVFKNTKFIKYHKEIWRENACIESLQWLYFVWQTGKYPMCSMPVSLDAKYRPIKITIDHYYNCVCINIYRYNVQNGDLSISIPSSIIRIVPVFQIGLLKINECLID